jgi:hypothetical protein
MVTFYVTLTVFEFIRWRTDDEIMKFREDARKFGRFLAYEPHRMFGMLRDLEKALPHKGPRRVRQNARKSAGLCDVHMCKKRLAALSWYADMERPLANRF